MQFVVRLLEMRLRHVSDKMIMKVESLLLRKPFIRQLKVSIRRKQNKATEVEEEEADRL